MGKQTGTQPHMEHHPECKKEQGAHLCADTSGPMTKIKAHLLFMPGGRGGGLTGVGGFLVSDTFYTFHLFNCKYIMYSKIRFKFIEGKPFLAIPQEPLRAKNNYCCHSSLLPGNWS